MFGSEVEKRLPIIRPCSLHDCESESDELAGYLRFSFVVRVMIIPRAIL
jgi:hypothetical protein